MTRSSTATTSEPGSIRRSPDRASIKLNVTTSKPAPRRLGQFFTPRPIADWMANWVCRDSPRAALDPAVGPGVFADALAALPRSRRPRRLHANDIDSAMIAAFRPPASMKCTITQADFITTPFDGNYDAVIANPPYVRHHDFAYSERIWRNFTHLTGAPVPRTTNLYGLFLLKIASLLSPNGRAAIITPSEWLRADFGVALKSYLLRENFLDALIQFDHASNVFDGVLTTACITLLRRGRAKSEPIRFATVSDDRTLATLNLEFTTAYAPADLSPEQKWTSLGNGPQSDRAARRLSDIAQCSRGIATGANGFFTLRPSDLKIWSISRRDVCPCITKARQIRGPHLTTADLRQLIADDERIFLLHPRTLLSPSIKKYLAHGVRLGIRERFLPSHRPVWYVPEHRNPAPILVSVFARGEFRFVWNEARVLNLTAYHGIYPRDGSVKTAKALFAWLISSAARESLRTHVRLYADGLLKVEPRDVESVAIPESLGLSRERLRLARKRG